jgi:cytochrome c oxidase assembly protein subunit 11
MSGSNARTAGKLALVAAAMFAFGYALVPLYNVLCEVTGLNGKTARIEAADAPEAIDAGRSVKVEFAAQAMAGLPWEFRPLEKSISVHPGETREVKYVVHNRSNEPVTGQAVPSVAPGLAAVHFKKIECFCFTQQTLKPGETREMPVRFVVSPKLPEGVQTLTLAYAFFNTDKDQAARYGGRPEEASSARAHAHHAGG